MPLIINYPIYYRLKTLDVHSTNRNLSSQKSRAMNKRDNRKLLSANSAAEASASFEPLNKAQANNPMDDISTLLRSTTCRLLVWLFWPEEKKNIYSHSKEINFAGQFFFFFKGEIGANRRKMNRWIDVGGGEIEELIVSETTKGNYFPNENDDVLKMKVKKMQRLKLKWKPFD